MAKRKRTFKAPQYTVFLDNSHIGHRESPICRNVIRCIDKMHIINYNVFMEVLLWQLYLFAWTIH